MAEDRPTTPYAVHPGVSAVRDWVIALPEKSGRGLDEWVALVKAEGPPTEKARRDWLKAVHKLGTNSAWWIAERAEGKGAEDDSPESYLTSAAEWVEAMFAGKRAALRPVFDEVLRLAKGLGGDVRACPCKTIVPFYRNHVFAQVKPTTNARIDLGLALADLPATGRLVDTGGFAKKDRITHRIPLSRADEIDDEVVGWLKRAYDRDSRG